MLRPHQPRARRGVLDVLQERDRDWAERHHVEQDAEAKKEFQQTLAQVKAETIKYLKRQGKIDRNDDSLRSKIAEVVTEILDQMRSVDITQSQAEEIKKSIVADITGLGPLEPLLKNPAITEIMVNNAKNVFVEEGGRIRRVDVEFDDDDHVRHVIDRIISPLGRRVDESSPIVDARLPDGSRVNAIIPPVAIDGPAIAIRKFPDKRLHAEDLINYGSAVKPMMDFLEACVKGERNIVVSGGTGSGKTTLLNILSNYIPDNERLLTMEDAAELRLKHMYGGNILRLEAKPPNIEGKGAVPIRRLLEASLRQRPDRIIVGECRDGVAFDMLQALNTGHEGSLTTIHANSPEECITRLESLVMQGGDLPHSVIRYNIGRLIHLIVQQSRMQDGSRKIVSIAQVLPYDPESNTVPVKEIFKFVQTGVDSDGKVVGHFTSTGEVPTFLPQLEAMGITIDHSMFDGGVIQ